MDLRHRLLRLRLLLKAHKRKALARARFPVPTHINPRHPSEPAEEVAEVVFLGVLGDVGHAQGGEIVAVPAGATHRLARATACTTHGGWYVLAADCRGAAVGVGVVGGDGVIIWTRAGICVKIGVSELIEICE